MASVSEATANETAASEVNTKIGEDGSTVNSAETTADSSVIVLDDQDSVDETSHEPLLTESSNY